MPKTYANDYNGLRTAIQEASPLAIKAISRIIKGTEKSPAIPTKILAEWINYNSKYPNNPSLLAIALTAKPPTFKILHSLLSIEGVDVTGKHNNQNQTALTLLTKATSLSLEQKHELFGLMVQRGLPGTSPFVTALLTLSIPADTDNILQVPNNSPYLTGDKSFEQEILDLLSQEEEEEEEPQLANGFEQRSSEDLLARAQALLAEGDGESKNEAEDGVFGVDLSELSSHSATQNDEPEDEDRSQQDSLITQADFDDSDWQTLAEEDEQNEVEGFVVVATPVTGIVSTQSALGSMTSPIGHVGLGNSLHQIQLGNHHV